MKSVFSNKIYPTECLLISPNCKYLLKEELQTFGHQEHAGWYLRETDPLNSGFILKKNTSKSTVTGVNWFHLCILILEIFFLEIRD